MNSILNCLCSGLLLSAFVIGQDPVVADPKSQLAHSAELELQKGIQELNGLRDQIAGEKLPVAQELTGAEESVAQQRRQYDEVSRLVDSGNLEIASVKAEMKLRQEELSYIGNLLDEYARSYDTKVNVSEMQVCGKLFERAKQASENTALSLMDKFGQQTDFLDMSVKRLFLAIGGMKFPGLGVDMQGSVVEGEFAILGPFALFCSKAGAAGLVVPQAGSDKPLIRPLEGPIQEGLAQLVQQGEGTLPVDPSRGGALKALVQKVNLIHIFEKGGPIMWPLLAASILALGTVLERLIFLANEKRKRNHKKLDELFSAIERGDTEGAARVSSSTKDFVVQVLGYALLHREQSMTNALLYAQSRELKRFRRGIPILDTVITLAPLLGLLGTVTGMMGSFSIIGGDLSSPGAITGGIAEALIATAFGLGIAITSLLPFNYLNTRLEEAESEIDSAANRLEVLVLGMPNHSLDGAAPAGQPAMQGGV
jgi:biopolymer transport protein ExbB